MVCAAGSDTEVTIAMTITRIMQEAGGVFCILEETGEQTFYRQKKSVNGKEATSSENNQLNCLLPSSCAFYIHAFIFW